MIVSFNEDGAMVFQGVCNRVTMQLQQEICLFMVGMHCMAHHTNLAMQTFQVICYLQSLRLYYTTKYIYFSNSLKYHVEYQRVAA